MLIVVTIPTRIASACVIVAVTFNPSTDPMPPMPVVPAVSTLAYGLAFLVCTTGKSITVEATELI